MIITRTKSPDASNVTKYCKLFRIPLDNQLWAALYGRHNTIIKLKLTSGSATSICRYFVGTDNASIKMYPLDVPVVNIGYIATDKFIDVYVNIDVSGAIIEMDVENPTLFTPYVKSPIDIDASALTMLSYANRTTKRTYVDTANVIKIDVYHRTVGNRVFVDGTIVLRVEKTTSGATPYAVMDKAVTPSSTTNMIISSVAGNATVQLATDGNVKILGTAPAGTYVIHQHYEL